MDVLILAGGEARRLGGADKPMVEIGGSTLLDRVIEACTEAVHDAPPYATGSPGFAAARAVASATGTAGAADAFGVVTVVGPVRPTRRPVRWVREDPPGGGPVAAIAAGLSVCCAPYVGVFAADLPFLTANVIHSLWTTITESGDSDGAVTVDTDGREQWLTAVYRREALLARIAQQRATGNDLRGLPLRRLVRDLRLIRIAPAGQSVLDCDTWEDVAVARRLAGPGRRPES